MKVISGLYKGRVLDGFDIDGTRPTMDRVKESLFATIQNYIPNSIVLDLFSGCGNLGIEALSNGSKFAYLCDNNFKAIKTINNNINKIGITNLEVINSDYKKCLRTLSDRDIKFDLIFLDPPYKTNYIEESLKLISDLKLLKSNGLIICESDSLDKIIYPNSFKSIKSKKYGDKYIVLLNNM